MSVFAAALAASAAGLAFQHFTIGMTIEDAKQVRLPDQDYGAVWITCSGDADASPYMTLSEGERSLGIIKCWPTEKIGARTSRASVEIGSDISATVELKFHEGMLYQIDTFYDEVHMETLQSALVRKYGTPTGRSDGYVQNYYGAEFDQTTLIWDMGNSRVTLMSPALNLKRMMVLYRDVPLSDDISEKLEEMKLDALSL